MLLKSCSTEVLANSDEAIKTNYNLTRRKAVAQSGPSFQYCPQPPIHHITETNFFSTRQEPSASTSQLLHKRFFPFTCNYTLASEQLGAPRPFLNHLLPVNTQGAQTQTTLMITLLNINQCTIIQTANTNKTKQNKPGNSD